MEIKEKKDLLKSKSMRLSGKKAGAKSEKRAEDMEGKHQTFAR